MGREDDPSPSLDPESYPYSVPLALEEVEADRFVVVVVAVAAVDVAAGTSAAPDLAAGSLPSRRSAVAILLKRAYFGG